MDNRLAALRHEIDEIMATGPIGRWTNPPTTFPTMEEMVVFNADGSGLITSSSGMSGTTKQAFEWSLECPGRLVLRYGKRENDLAFDGDEEPDDENEDTSEISVTMDFEIKIMETEFGPWPVMTTRSSDEFQFGFLLCALARADPPLVLPSRPPVI
jgi:hypothetical protein